MIKKYTFLIYAFFFFICGQNRLSSEPASTVFFPDVQGQASDPVLTEEEQQTVWSANGSIYIRTRQLADVNIYTITGQLTKQVKVTEGETAIPMSRGLYIVRIGSTARKVVVR